MARKRRPEQTPTEYFFALIEEGGEHRANVLENVSGLVEANAYDALKAILKNKGVTKFLLEDELDFLRQFVTKEEGGPCRLH